jgi:hypothetical protein
LEAVTMKVELRKAFKVRSHMVELRGPTSSTEKIENTAEVSYTETCKGMKKNGCYNEKELQGVKNIYITVIKNHSEYLQLSHFNCENMGIY